MQFICKPSYKTDLMIGVPWLAQPLLPIHSQVRKYMSAGEYIFLINASGTWIYPYYNERKLIWKKMYMCSNALIYSKILTQKLQSWSLFFTWHDLGSLCRYSKLYKRWYFMLYCNHAISTHAFMIELLTPI